ncbi:MAG: ribosomal maturation YjgA family protein [Planctomycetota bacterium]|jgi:hypothetical protein
MDFTRKRVWILVCLAIVTPLGFGMWRYYNGWAERWIRYYLSGAVYEIFWCLVLFFLWPRKANIIKIPIIVFFATCILEFAQLWKPQFLQEFRRTLIGAALIGTDFVWRQFPYYVLGTIISILLLRILATQTTTH